MGLFVTLFWNREERRLRAFWRLVLFNILFVLLLGGVFLSLPQGLFNRSPSGLVLNQIVQLLIIILSTWLATRYLDRRSFTDLGLQLNRNWWRDYGFGLALGALLMTGIFLAELAAGWIRVNGTFHTPGPGSSFAQNIFFAALLFIGVGISEELLFRGYLLRNLAEGFRISIITPEIAVILAWILSSFVFGLGHAANPNASVISTVTIMLAGLFLGLGYMLLGRLAIPIGLHITWNFFQGNVFGFPVSGVAPSSVATFIAIEQQGPDLWTGGRFGPEAGLMGMIAIAIGSLFILVWARRRYGSVGIDSGLALPPKRQAAQEHPE